MKRNTEVVPASLVISEWETYRVKGFKRQGIMRRRTLCTVATRVAGNEVWEAIATAEREGFTDLYVTLYFL